MPAARLWSVWSYIKRLLIGISYKCAASSPLAIYRENRLESIGEALVCYHYRKRGDGVMLYQRIRELTVGSKAPEDMSLDILEQREPLIITPQWHLSLLALWLHDPHSNIGARAIAVDLHARRRVAGTDQEPLIVEKVIKLSIPEAPRDELLMR